MIIRNCVYLIVILTVGTCVSNPAFSMLDCSGGTDYAEISDSPSLDVTATMTVAVWVQFDATSAQRLIERRDNTSIIWEVYLRPTGWGGKPDIAFAVKDSTDVTRIAAGGTTIATATWYHVLVRYANGETNPIEKIYLNGVLDGSTNSWNNINTSTATPIRICEGTTTEDNQLNGRIGEIAMWNVALSQNEITLLALSRVARMPLQIRPSNLVFYLPLDDCADAATCTGSSLDLTPNGNHAAYTNSPTGKAQEVLSYP